MSNGVIARLLPRPASAYFGTAGYYGINGNFPAGNLADPQPKTVVQGNTGAGSIGVVVDIDYGANTEMDGLAIIGTNVSAANGWWDAFATADGTALPAIGAETGGQRLAFTGLNGAFGVAPTTRSQVRHGVALGATVSRRYVRVYLRDQLGSNPDGVVRAGIISAVKTIVPFWNFEDGDGRKVEDQSTVRLLPGGETAIERGGRTPIWKGSWGDLTDTELRTIWSLLIEVGTGAPVMVIEDPDAVAGQNECIHYGCFTSLEFTERIRADKQRIDVTLREMV